MKSLVIAAGAVALLSTPANAQHRISTQTIVWVSEEAMSKGLRLLGDGAGFNVVAPLIACMPNPGERVSITDAGFTKHEITIIDGENAGCSGWVPVEHVD
jgi:hypothetical protein